MTERTEYLEKKRPGNIALLIAIVAFTVLLFSLGFVRTAGLFERAAERTEQNKTQQAEPAAAPLPDAP